MAHLLIDGYNLIGIAHSDLENARRDIIQKLCEYTKIKGHTVTLVFDGWKNGQLKETVSKLGGLKIVYSKLGENADSVIKRILSSSTKHLIVVSSDREISDFAWRKGFAAVTSDEFESKLHATGKQRNNNEPSSYDKDKDADARPFHQKGNPRRLSKREKKRLGALGNL